MFFYQENLSLFVFSGEYLQQFTIKPGGLLEYAGNFFIQGYFSYLYGSVILSLVFTLLAIIFLKINKRHQKNEELAIFPILPDYCYIVKRHSYSIR